MAETADVGELIAEYRAAFLAANGREIETVDYAKGWFTLRAKASSIKTKHRRRAVEQMLAALRARQETP